MIPQEMRPSGVPRGVLKSGQGSRSSGEKLCFRDFFPGALTLGCWGLALECRPGRGKVEISMKHRRDGIAWGLWLAPMLFASMLAAQAVAPNAAPAAPPKAAHVHHKSHKTQKELVLPPLPSGPLSQMPMDQIPASPAKVSYQDGKLAISAQNSSLGEILREVRKLTGASIDIPQGSGANERVVGQFGPGAPRDILADLLNGSSFNYVMLGSSADPNSLSSVLLTSKSSSPGDMPTQTAANTFDNGNNGPMMPPHPQPFMQPGFGGQAGRAGNAQPVPGANDDAKDEDQDPPDDSADDQSQPGQAVQPEAADGNNQGQQPDPNAPNAGPKSPEQVLDMLRRQQPPGSAPQQPPPPPQ